MDKDKKLHMGYCLRREDDVFYGASLRPYMYLREGSRMNQIDVMKQALALLEALSIDDNFNEEGWFKHWGDYPDGLYVPALRQAIEQAEFDAQSELDDQNRTPPTAPAQPLTDEQIADAYFGGTGQHLRPQDNALARQFARAIEIAHGIKGASL
jgi:hypothetical protein